MEIIFDNERQKNEFLKTMTRSCPEEFGLVEDCKQDTRMCIACWANALEDVEIKVKTVDKEVENV